MLPTNALCSLTTALFRSSKENQLEMERQFFESVDTEAHRLHRTICDFETTLEAHVKWFRKQMGELKACFADL